MIQVDSVKRVCHIIGIATSYAVLLMQRVEPSGCIPIQQPTSDLFWHGHLQKPRTTRKTWHQINVTIVTFIDCLINRTRSSFRLVRKSVELRRLMVLGLRYMSHTTPL